MAVKKLKYPPEFKKEVCDYAKKENYISAAMVYDLHRNTVSNWVRKYEEAGIKGFIVKRNDTQRTKLTKELVVRIAKYKRRNPGATLQMIKDKFALDCHLTLISRKLRKVYTPPKKNKQKDALFLRTKIIRDTENSNHLHPVFRLSLHLCSGKPLSVGFTSWYSSEKICLFIRYSLEKLKAAKSKRNFSRIVTNTKFIKQSDFKTIVSVDHQIVLEIIGTNEINICSENDIGFSGKNIRHSIIDSYERILDSYDNKELDDTLLASLVNVDELSKQDLFEKGWDSLFMPTETKRSLYSALEKIKQKGNQAVLNFDYDSAKEEYDKAYTAMTIMKLEDKEMYLSVLIAKAKLYYNTEKYQTALMLFRDIVRFSKKNNYNKELADAYYYTGLIYRSFHNINGSVKYFKLSAKVLDGSSGIINKCMFNRAKYRVYLTQGKYDQAEKFSKIYYEYAIKTKDKELIGNCLSTRGAYFYSKGEVGLFESQMIEAKKYNLDNANFYEASKNIMNLFSIYSYYILKEEKVIEALLFELKVVSEKIKIPHLLYESMFRLGIFYFNKSKYYESLKILTNALPGIKKYLEKEVYLTVLYYLGRLNFYEGNNYLASRIVTPLLNEAKLNKNKLYVMHSLRYLAKIYFEINNLKRAITTIKKVLTLSLQLKELYIYAEFHELYGDICIRKNMKKISQYHYFQAKRALGIYSKDKKLDVSKEIDKIQDKINNCNI